MKKILILLPSLVGGGAEKVAVMVANGLSARGHAVTMALLERTGECSPSLSEDISIVELKKRSRWSLGAVICRLHRAVVFNKPDVILSFFLYEHIVVLGVFGLLKGVRPRWVVSVRGLWPRPCAYGIFYSFFVNKVLSAVYRRADHILAVSKGLQRYVCESFGISGEKSTVVYNPVDTTAIEDIEQNGLSDVALSDTRPAVVAVGRLAAVKRYPVLIRAFARQQAEACLVIVGTGPLLEELRQLCVQLEIQQSVYFAGFQYNIYPWYLRATVFVSASESEGCPNALLEAMACGLPVVSTDCEWGPREIITDNVNGLLTSVNDEIQLAEAMEKLLCDEQLRHSLGKAARKRAASFRVEKIVAEYEQILCGG